MIDVVVIGGGQAGLAAGYFLRRTGLEFVILDAARRPGGSWQHMWPSLRLFSPAEHSPLPGWPMPRQPGTEYPGREHVVDYLSQYEQRYALPVHRPADVVGVHNGSDHLEVHTDGEVWHARSVISATGTWQSPYMPSYAGQTEFTGCQLHTVSYRAAEEFHGQHVVIVGGGNSAAQILAEVSIVAETTWCTRRPPRFMPDDVDGRVLFDVATRRRTGTASHRAGTAESDGVAGVGGSGVRPARPPRQQLRPVRRGLPRSGLHGIPPRRYGGERRGGGLGGHRAAPRRPRRSRPRRIARPADVRPHHPAWRGLG